MAEWVCTRSFQLWEVPEISLARNERQIHAGKLSRARLLEQAQKARSCSLGSPYERPEGEGGAEQSQGQALPARSHQGTDGGRGGDVCGIGLACLACCLWWVRPFVLHLKKEFAS